MRRFAALALSVLALGLLPGCATGVAMFDPARAREVLAIYNVDAPTVLPGSVEFFAPVPPVFPVPAVFAPLVAGQSDFPPLLAAGPAAIRLIDVDGASPRGNIVDLERPLGGKPVPTAACYDPSAALEGQANVVIAVGGGTPSLRVLATQDFSVKTIALPQLGNNDVSVLFPVSRTAVLAGSRRTAPQPYKLLLVDIASGTVTSPAGAPSDQGFGSGVNAISTLRPVVLNAEAREIAAAIADPILVGFNFAGVYRSTDGGQTFAAANAGIPSFTSVYAFAPTPSGGLAATSAGLYRTADGGQTWTKASGTGGLPNGAAKDVASSGSDVWAALGSSALVARSADGGATWQTSGAGLVATQINSLRVLAGTLLAATDGGVYRSVDKGVTWSLHPQSPSNAAPLRILTSGDTVWMGTFGNRHGVARSTDGGATWAGSNAALNFKIVRALAASGNVIVAAGESGAFRSADGGLTFSALGSGSGLPSGATVYALQRIGSTFYAGLNPGGVYRSTDGATWSASGAGLPASLAVTSLLADGNALYVGAPDAIYRSLDAGATWSGPLVPNPTTGYSVWALAVHGGALYAGLYGFGLPESHGLFKSTNGGTTWQPAQSGLPSNTPVFALASAAGTLFAGLRSGLYQSVNGGQTWTPAPSPLGNLDTFSLAATSTRLLVGTATSGLFSMALSPRADRIVPIVLDVDTGRAHYTTELTLTNRGTTLAGATLSYTGSIGTGSGSTRALLSPGQQMVIPDTIAHLRQNGVAIGAGNAGGTLLVSFDGLSSTDAGAVLARTTTATAAPQPAGAAGLAYAGLDPAESSVGRLTIYGLRSNATDRSNVAVFSASADPVTVRVTVFPSGGGTPFVAADALSLPPWGWYQFNSPLDAAGLSNGWVRIERTSATGTFGAYGVVNDNGTSDGSFLLPTRDDGVPPYLNVPVLVETSAFQSELVLTNASTQAATFTVTYRESLSPGGGAGGTFALAMPAATQLVLPDAVAWLRSRGVPLGPKGAASYAGSLHVDVSGPAGNQTFAGARTSSLSPASGQFGLFTPTVYGGAEGTDRAWLYGLKQDANNRSNVAVVNTGATAAAGSITLRLQAYDGDDAGAAAGSPDDVTIAPGEWRQLSGYLGGKGVRNGWVGVTRTAGGAAWIAYGVVNDGGGPGQRTGDGAYVPMIR